jgi:hypothetical protein
MCCTYRLTLGAATYAAWDFKRSLHLMLQAGSRPRGVIGGRLPEGVVQDQSPAGSAFVVLPQPGRELVEIQEPPSLLVAREILVVKFGKRSL